MDPNAELACTTGEPEVCVLAEDRLLLPETVTRARPILRRLQRIAGAPTRALPMGLVEDDPTVLGVEPGRTTPWGGVDREWGGDVSVAVHDVFAPESYCGANRLGLVPRPLRGAFAAPVELLVWWVDPAQDFYYAEDISRPAIRNERGRELTERFEASTDTQRSAFGARVLAAARGCDPEAAVAAADALARVP